MISEELKARMREAVARYPSPRSAMLPCLHLIQDEIGYIPTDGLVAVAEVIGVKPDEVESIVTFYSMFHQSPQGTYVIKVCSSVSCYLMGADDTLGALERKLGVRRGETTPDGKFTLETVECLAACGMAPALQVNGIFIEHASGQRAEALVDYLASGGELAAVRNAWALFQDGSGMVTETTFGATPDGDSTTATKKAR